MTGVVFSQCRVFFSHKPISPTFHAQLSLYIPQVFAELTDPLLFLSMQMITYPFFQWLLGTQASSHTFPHLPTPCHTLPHLATPCHTS